MGTVEPMPEQLTAACAQSAELYERIGYEPPWVSYLAVDSGRAVGGGAFVGAPREGLVEIAYFTLPGLQGRGYATQTATHLLTLARQVSPALAVRAFTLPRVSASTRILERLGFTRVGMAHDDDAGEVWEWRA